jgi:hypothetical protein
VIVTLLPLAALGFAGPPAPPLRVVGTNKNAAAGERRAAAGRSLSSSLSLSSSSSTQADETTKTVTLTKPLGLLLEEVQEGAARGVFVQDVTATGSAFAMADELRGWRLAKVMDTDCSALTFDAVMDLIRNSNGDEVTLSFAPLILPSSSAVGTTPSTAVAAAATVVAYAEGTVVTMRVQQTAARKPDLVFQAKVGDNLRQALIANGVEVYQGMQKLSNCG